MKKVIQSLLFILPFVITSCSLKQIANNRLEQKVLGKWDIQSINSSLKPDSALQLDFDAMLHTLLINATIEFSSEHKFNGKVAGKNYSGDWMTESRSMKLSLTENKKETVYSMVFMKANELQLRGKEGKEDYVIKLLKQGELQDKLKK